MKRRQILNAAALAAAAVPAGAAASPAPVPRPGPPLLTLTGAIGKTNRGPLDPALDQLMKKQQVRFEKAFSLDFDALAALKSVSIRPTLEYDQRPHALRGPLLGEVLQAAGAPQASTSRVVLRAIDGYAVTLPLSQLRRQGFIVATHLDDRPMPVGGLGPLWAVFDADRDAEAAARPLAERFAHCPWGLYHVEVLAS